MALNMKSLTQALAKTAAVIEKHVQSTVQEVTGPRPLQDYELVEQIGSGGPALAWKLYLARPRNKAEHAHNPEVCVWVLDKKNLSETRQRIGITKAAEDAFLEVLRADAAQMLKLRHPGVLRVVQALDESKTAMAMVTEPIFASIANALGNHENITRVPKELKGLELGILEIKHGMLQLAETLSFLHDNAQLVHRAISPESVYITSSGSWKFGGFGFATTVEQARTEGRTGASFHYPEYDVDEVFMPLQPPLNYTAPELTRGNGSPGPCSDIFSLGLVLYHLLNREPLIQSNNNLRAYKNKVQYLSSSSFTKLPAELLQDLLRMISLSEMSRPSASEFTGSPFFREDTRLRALRFLDHMLERDNMQKTDFLKALSGMWKEFDARVLRYKVLPQLCLELRNVIMLPMVLPMVLTIAESQEKADFESSTLPALLPVLSSATGDALLMLVKHAALLINKVGSDALATSVIPMLVRAYDDPDARMQEEVLKRTLSVAKQIDYQVLKQSILPRIHGLALKTTVAAVRVNALLCLEGLIHRLDKNAISDVLQTLHRCVAVDHTAPTLMCTLGVADASYKQFGVEFAAENLLPLLTPLLTAQQLNSQQFSKYLQFVREVLREIEEKRGVKEQQGDSASSGEAFKGASMNGNNTRNESSWDSDLWSSSKREKTPAPTGKPVASGGKVSSAPALPEPATTTGSSFEWPPASNSGVTTSGKVDHSPMVSQVSFEPAAAISTGSTRSSFEWPPVSGTNVRASSEATSKLQESGFGDDFDPFADWPPKSSSGTPAYGIGAAAAGGAQKKMNDASVGGGSLDVGEFFSSGGGDQKRIHKLAPPPPAVAGIGRGGAGRGSRLRQGAPGKQQKQQQLPPGLDLLQ